MNAKLVDLNPYKSKFKLFFSITAAVLVICYLLVIYGFQIIKNQEQVEQIKNLFMILLIGSAIFYSFWQQKKRRALLAIEDFQSKIGSYFNIYMSRLYWHMLSGMVSSLVYLVTNRRLFLIFAVLDLVTMVLVFPNKLVVKRELMDDEIEFIG